MKESDLNQAIQTKTFGFNVPCREFVISAQVTRDRRMPMVDEFVLRTLDVVESISISRLARYFGFDGRDLGIVLADLQSRSLISLSREEVSLHPSAKELFRTAGDAPPAITAVDSFHARVWFDLVSQNMIASRGLHNVKHLLPLKPVPSRMDIEAGFAREAFNLNFRDYLRTFRRIKNPDAWSLYAILDVQPGRYSYAQISGSEHLILEGSPKLETTLFPTEGDRPGRLKLLTDAMAQEVRKLNDPVGTLAARAEYSKLVGSDSIEKATQSNGYIDLREWLRIENSSIDAQSKPFIGYPYIERNRRELGMLLSQIEGVTISSEREWTLTWLRPGGSSWGVTEDLGNLLSDLRAAVRRLSFGSSTPSTSLIVPAAVTAKNARAFNRLFDYGYHAEAGWLTLGVEVLVVPQVCALVSVVVPLTETIRVPIGRMTTDKALVQRISQRSQIDQSVSHSTLLWGGTSSRTE
ncbi:MAG: hypothetical protein ACR65R_15985 [Methylomicrobium sp.]